jgi:hypothetical protein
LILLVQLFACGTLMYPERRGQKGGRIDAGIAVLDGIGLLFFIIPGVIAYAVDFSTGAIYLPGTHRSSPSGKGMKIVHVDPADLNEKTIQEIIVRETGVSESLDLKKAEVCALNGPEDISAKFAELKESGYRTE